MKIKSVLSLSLCMAMMMSVSVKAESRMLGDIDGDGKVTAKDALKLQKYVIHLAQLDEKALKAADVNGDGKITNKDALEILRYVLKLSKNEKIGTLIE